MIDSSCPVCYSKQLLVFFELPKVPVHCNLLWPSRKTALQAPKGIIELAICQDCGHVFNHQFNPELMQYTQQYENALDFSPRFQRYLNELASDLVARFQLYHKDILEIGCGQGEFLRLLCKLGDNRGIGFDPAAPSIPDGTDRYVNFIQDFYSEKYAGYPADFVCSRQTLEHIAGVREFMEHLHKALFVNIQRKKDQSGVTVFFEVPNARFILDRLSIWDIIYEHPSHFTRTSISRLMKESGFLFLSVRESYEDQFLCIEGKAGEMQHESSPDHYPQAEENLIWRVQAFADIFRRKLDHWQRQLETARLAGKKVALWGAGSKGVSFMNMVCPESEVVCVVDINPRKHGMYIAGTGQEIIPPERLPDFHPDQIIIMNSIYEGEIRGQVDKLGLRTEFLTA